MQKENTEVIPMTEKAALKILEIMAIDLAGSLEWVSDRSSMADEIQQRLKAIHVAKEALTKKWARGMDVNSEPFHTSG